MYQTDWILNIELGFQTAFQATLILPKLSTMFLMKLSILKLTACL